MKEEYELRGHTACNKEEGRKMKEEYDLRWRTKNFALRVIGLFGSLPKTALAHIHRVSSFFLLPSSFLCLLLFTGCFSRPAAMNGPGYKRYTLAAEHIWQMNLPQGRRFDASGLFLEKSGDLLTESDQQIGVYRIRFQPGGSSVDLERVPDCFTAAQLAPFAREKFGRYDCEGVTEDGQGRIYLCEEADRWILRWDPRTKTVERLKIDWSPVKKYFSSDRNAAWEGIAIHGSTLYVANERKKGRIIAVDLNTLKVTDSFALPASHSLWYEPHYSDLCWFEGALYALMREDHVILKIDPETHLALAEYNFAGMENDPHVAYYKVVPLVVGVMEGLAVDRHYFWLCTDNNGLARKNYPGDTRPTLFQCRRPDAN
jgi:glutamine cyclotransferase